MQSREEVSYKAWEKPKDVKGPQISKAQQLRAGRVGSREGGPAIAQTGFEARIRIQGSAGLART